MCNSVLRLGGCIVDNPHLLCDANRRKKLMRITTALAIRAITVAMYVLGIAVMLLAVGNGWNAGQLSIALLSIVGGAEIAKALVKINYYINKKENKIDS